MAGASLLSLLDDIATLVADDLAVNANQVTGISAKRELAVVWMVAKGAALNKVILLTRSMISVGSY